MITSVGTSPTVPQDALLRDPGPLNRYAVPRHHRTLPVVESAAPPWSQRIYRPVGFSLHNPNKAHLTHRPERIRHARFC